jgi:sortase A
MSRGADAVRTVLRGAGQTLITVGVVLLLFCVYELKVTNLVTARAQEQLADDLQAQWARRSRRADAAPTPTRRRCCPASPPPAPPRHRHRRRRRPVAGRARQRHRVLRIPRLGDWNDRPSGRRGRG